jgi:hypothetical protein
MINGIPTKESLCMNWDLDYVVEDFEGSILKRGTPSSEATVDKWPKWVRKRRKSLRQSRLMLTNAMVAVLVRSSAPPFMRLQIQQQQSGEGSYPGDSSTLKDIYSGIRR